MSWNRKGPCYRKDLESTSGSMSVSQFQLSPCYGLNVYIPQNSYVEALIPCATVSGVGPLGGNRVMMILVLL